MLTECCSVRGCVEAQTLLACARILGHLLQTMDENPSPESSTQDSLINSTTLTCSETILLYVRSFLNES